MDHPKKPEPFETSLTVMGLMVWVAGLAAVAGLVEEVIRLARIEPAAGLIGGVLVAYVIYVSLSVPVIWKAPPLVVPTTMLIGGVLWTLALQLIERRNLAVALVVLPILPFLTVFIVRMIFRRAGVPDGPATYPDRPSMVRCLLMRSRGFGPRSAPVEAEVGPEAS